jgi:hypothetical protein
MKIWYMVFVGNLVSPFSAYFEKCFVFTPVSQSSPK